MFRHQPVNISLSELWTIWTLANSALVDSDPKKIDPSQFGHRPLVNSDLDHWSIRTSTTGQFGPRPLVNSDLLYWSIRTSNIKILWSIRTFSVGQFGPFPLVNSDPFLGQFGPFLLVNSDHPIVISIKNLRSDLKRAIIY